MVDLMSSHDQQKIQNFLKEHPDIDFNTVYDSFKNSKYGSYDLSEDDFSFKPVIYFNILYLLFLILIKINIKYY